MAFVMLDCEMLDSSIWWEKAQRDLFITALLMAEPYEVRNSMEQIKVGSLELAGWQVPVGWYGFVRAASSGIIHRAMVEKEEGLKALVKLGDPEEESKSSDFQGRRMVRVDGGFIILNYVKYRDKDHSGAERSRRWRARNKLAGKGTPQKGEQEYLKAANNGASQEQLDTILENNLPKP